MNKKSLLIFLASLTLGLSACSFFGVNKNNQPTDDYGKEDPYHVHTYEWQYNDYQHWQVATCQHDYKVENTNYGDHQFTMHTDSNGNSTVSCSVCGYQGPILSYREEGNDVIITGFKNLPNIKSITSVTIPSKINDKKVTVIDEWAFCHSSNEEPILTEVKFEEPSNVRLLKQSCFSQNDLKEIRIPDSVQEIQEYAFANNQHASKVFIPSSVQRIGQLAFSSVPAAFYIESPVPGMNWSSDIGSGHMFYGKTGPDIVYGDYEYVIDSDGKLIIARYTGQTSILNVHSDVIYNGKTYQATTVASYAFAYNEYITRLSFMDGIEKIESPAIYKSMNIKSVYIAASVEYIEGYAFTWAGKPDIYVAAKDNMPGWEDGWQWDDGYLCKTYGVTNILNFTEDFTYTVADGGAEIIGVDILDNAKELVIPETIDNFPVTKLCKGLVEDHESLEKVTIPSTVKEIEQYAFTFCTKLKKVIISESEEGPSLEIIGDYAFRGCTSLEEFTIPLSVRSIGDYAFFECYKLKGIALPADLESIGEGAFSQCFSITSVNIPKNVEVIPDYAFSGCVSLKDINISYGVKEIGMNAFFNCPFVSLYIPYSVSTIEYSSFSYTYDSNHQTIEEAHARGYLTEKECEKLSEARVYLLAVSSLYEYDSYGYFNFNGRVAFNARSTNFVDGDFEYYLNGLGAVVLAYRGEGGDVVIPDSITYDEKEYDVVEIGYQAFCGNQTLTTVTLPSKLRIIGEYAFANSSLKEVTVPSSVTTIKESAFNNSVERARLSKGITSLSENAFGFNFAMDGEEQKHTIVVYEGSLSEIFEYTTAETKSYNNVTYYGKMLDFPFDVDGFTYAQISETTARLMSANCYADDFNETTVVIPDTVQNGDLTLDVAEMSESIFEGFISIESVKLPKKLVSIPKSAFRNCDNLVTINIPDSVISIAMNAFANCGALVLEVIPANVKTIGEYAFYQCDSLVSITIKGNEVSIGDSAFYGCYALISVTIEGENATVEKYAFSKCYKLATFDRPDSTSVGVCAFEYTNVTGVVYSFVGTVRELRDANYSEVYSCSKAVIKYDNGNDPINNIRKGDFDYFENLKDLKIAKGVTVSGFIYVDTNNGPDGGGLYGLTKLEKLSMEFRNNIGAYFGTKEMENSTRIEQPISNTPTINNTLKTSYFYIPNSLKEVEILNTDRAVVSFANCSKLETITFADEYKGTELYQDLFYNCSSLKSFVVPNEITRISANAFKGCSSLTSITLNSKLKMIMNYAFENCSSLTAITIPSDVNIIQPWTFRGCSSLAEIHFENQYNWHYYVCDEEHPVSQISSSDFTTWEGFKDLTPAQLATYLTGTYKDRYLARF